MLLLVYSYITGFLFFEFIEEWHRIDKTLELQLAPLDGVITNLESYVEYDIFLYSYPL